MGHPLWVSVAFLWLAQARGGPEPGWRTLEVTPTHGDFIWIRPTDADGTRRVSLARDFPNLAVPRYLQEISIDCRQRRWRANSMQTFSANGSRLPGAGSTDWSPIASGNKTMVLISGVTCGEEALPPVVGQDLDRVFRRFREQRSRVPATRAEPRTGSSSGMTQNPVLNGGSAADNRAQQALPPVLTSQPAPRPERTYRVTRREVAEVTIHGVAYWVHSVPITGRLGDRFELAWRRPAGEASYLWFETSQHISVAPGGRGNLYDPDASVVFFLLTDGTHQVQVRQRAQSMGPEAVRSEFIPYTLTVRRLR